MKITYNTHNLYYPSPKLLNSIRNNLVWPTLQAMHKDSVKDVILNYKSEYQRLHKNDDDFDDSLPIPVGLAMDGRWQKRYGWNSLVAMA